MLKIDEKDKPMWLWVFDIIKAMDSGCGILVGHHVHFDGPVANSTEYIIKSEYDKLKAELDKERTFGDASCLLWNAELERLNAENKMLKSSDHVRETMKSKEINKLRAALVKIQHCTICGSCPNEAKEALKE